MGAAFEPKVEIVPVSSLRIDPRNPRKRLRDLIENPKVLKASQFARAAPLEK
jgi:hypothetical protein